MKFYLFCLLFFPLVSPADESQKYLSTVPIPQEIFDLIKKDYSINSFDYTPEFFDVQAVIKNKDKEQKISIGYSLEVLDLSSYVDKAWESFNFGLMAPFEIDETTRLYFVSRYKETDIGSQTLGLSCGQALKIQKNLKKLFSSSGMKMTTKTGQYLSLLGGDYILLKKDGSKFKIVFFKIRDGRWSHRLCNLSL